MTLRNALLGLLAWGPRTGYEMLKIFRGPLSHVWAVTHSQLYTELGRMLDEGLIREVGAAERAGRMYEITETGSRYVVAWLIATEPARETRNESLLRIFFLGLVPRPQAEAYLRSESAVHREKLAAFERDLASPPAENIPGLAWSRLVLEWGIRYERAIAEWLDWAAEHMPPSSTMPHLADNRSRGAARPTAAGPGRRRAPGGGSRGSGRPAS